VDMEPVLPDAPAVPPISLVLHQSHNLLHPPELAGLQLGIDPVHHLIICEDHGYAVSRKDLASHFHKNHRGQHLPLNIDAILDTYNVPQDAPPHPTSLIAPIQSIPCQPGFYCLICNFASLQHNSITKNHLYKEHPGVLAEDCIKGCTVQMIFWKKTLGVEQVWAVDPSYSTIPAGDQEKIQFLQHLKAKEAELEEVNVIQEPADPRHTSIFLRRFQWLTATDGLPFKKLRDLTAKPVKKDNEFPGLEERVDGYFTRLRPLVMGMQPLVLKWINTPDE
jgi:Orsellinic acid/F9775 biosynthesis cluster protein D